MTRDAVGSSSNSSAPTAAPALAPSASTAAIAKRRSVLISIILRQAREGFLKLALLGWLATVLLPVPARADELLVGTLRDQDGRAVADAAVTGLDSGGAVVARDRTAADGTFALAGPTRPATVVVAAADADSVRIAVPPGESPLTAVVHRHRAADLIPSVADLAALPAGSAAALAGVVPYRVTFTSAISDRWLARGRGVTTVEGLPFYRRSDGADITGLLPGHAIGAFAVHDPLHAPWYGDRAGGGMVDGRLFDRGDDARLTSRDGALLAGDRSGAFAATSWDPDGNRALLAARDAIASGPFALNLVGAIGSAPGANYAGGGADLRAATRSFDLGGHLALTRSAQSGTALNEGSVTDVALDATARGPNAIAVRLRWRAESGVIGGAVSEHHDGALVLGTARGNVLRASAAVAFAYGDDDGYSGTPSAAGGTAILPSLALDAPLGGGWSFHAGATGSSLGTPGVAIARSSLGEAAIAYADGRRLHAELIAYAEGDLVPSAVNRGVGASLGWEIAPRLSLRAWSLRDGDLQLPAAATYPAPPLRPAFRTFDRDFVWLTWDATARFDVLLRSHAVEGNVRIPIAARYALSAGSYLGRDGKRTAAAGLVHR